MFSLTLVGLMVTVMGQNSENTPPPPPACSSIVAGREMSLSRTGKLGGKLSAVSQSGKLEI